VAQLSALGRPFTSSDRNFFVERDGRARSKGKG
jgi:hypothetical protein